jgi:ABC-type multidrug transport system fused ATPase/permease subunit
MTGLQLYLRLLSYVRPYWKIFAASVLGMLITASTEVAMPAAAKPFLDGTFVDKDPVLMRWILSCWCCFFWCAESDRSSANTPAAGSRCA